MSPSAPTPGYLIACTRRSRPSRHCSPAQLARVSELGWRCCELGWCYSRTGGYSTVLQRSGARWALPAGRCFGHATATLATVKVGTPQGGSLYADTHSGTGEGNCSGNAGRVPGMERRRACAGGAADARQQQQCQTKKEHGGAVSQLGKGIRGKGRTVLGRCCFCSAEAPAGHALVAGAVVSGAAQVHRAGRERRKQCRNEMEEAGNGGPPLGRPWRPAPAAPVPGECRLPGPAKIAPLQAGPRHRELRRRAPAPPRGRRGSQRARARAARVSAGPERKLEEQASFRSSSAAGTSRGPGARVQGGARPRHGESTKKREQRPAWKRSLGAQGGAVPARCTQQYSLRAARVGLIMSPRPLPNAQR